MDFFSRAALALLAVYYGAYFLKMLLQRRRGIRTDQMGQGAKSPRTLRVERLLRLSTVLAVPVEVISLLLGGGNRPGWLAAPGLVLTAAGTAVFLLAMWTMRDSWRAGIPAEDKTELVTGGIYRFSRNPAFLGFDLTYIGVFLLCPNPVLFLSSAWGILMIHLQILEEEQFLSAAFGPAYDNYRRKTGRYLFF